MSYRGIVLDDCVRLYNKNGTNNKNVKRSLDSLADLLESNGHVILSKYVNDHTDVLIDFNCEHNPRNIKPHNYKYGRGCAECGIINVAEKRLKQSREDLLLLIENNGHKMLSEYVYNKDKVIIDFMCGHEPSPIRPNDYKNGTGCSICRESKGEKIIRKWLEGNNFEFEAQKEFNGLVGLNGGDLSYDFYLLKQNILIEYQGEFHDGNVGGYTIINLEKQQEHDRRKKEYAKSHNIELLEIWYWDYESIEQILQGELIKQRNVIRNEAT